MKAPLKANSVVGDLILKYKDKEIKYNLIVKDEIKKLIFLEAYLIILRI